MLPQAAANGLRKTLSEDEQIGLPEASAKLIKTRGISSIIGGSIVNKWSGSFLIIKL